MAITLTNDTLKFRESTSDPWERLLIQANINFNLIYPVGSIYMSTVNVDPGTIFGGTWERLKDRFLLGAGDTYTAGDTGGEATHTLTVNEMPSHTHSLKGGSSSSINDYFGGSTENYGIYSGGTSQSGDNITNTGGGAAHNNMPPYLVVYMWRRLTLSPTVYTPPANVLIGEVASEDIVPVSKGGTGANNAAAAIANLGALSSTLPHITEIGSSGAWSWTLYNDNTVDLYWYSTMTITNYASSTTGGLYEFGPINLPFSIQTGYNFTAGCKIGNGISIIALCNPLSGSRIDVIGQGNVTGEQSCSASVHIHGKKA